jgi:Uncharacterized protein conserved in bacteria
MNEDVRLGRYRHFKGNDYELIMIATYSETLEKVAVYKALYGEEGIWVRPLDMFTEEIVHNGIKVKRYTYIEEISL